MSLVNIGFGDLGYARGSGAGDFLSK